MASFPLAKLLGFVAESLLPRRRGHVSYGHQRVGETKTSPFLRLSLIFFCPLRFFGNSSLVIHPNGFSLDGRIRCSWE